MNLKIKSLMKSHAVQLFAICFCLIVASGTAKAVSYTVTNTSDSGAGSLRQAVTDASTDAAGVSDDTINFNINGCSNNVCTIALTSGELPINPTATAGKLLVTNAGGTSRIIISGGGNSRVFYVSPGADLTIDSVTITGGNGTGTTNAGFNGLGGGIAVVGSSSTSTTAPVFTALTVNNSTISGNTISTGNAQGGGIYSNGNSAAGTKPPTLTIANSTVSGNTAVNGTAGNGGGLYISRTAATITNSTIAANTTYTTGGGIYILSNTATTVAARNTIFASNTVTTSQPDIFKGPNSTFTSNGYNLVGVNSTSGAITYASTDVRGVSALLAPLGDYGGLTRTHALLSSSPAIDAGSPTGPSRDQRGATRTGTGGSTGNLDIGAFEVSNSVNSGNFVAVLPPVSVNTSYSYNIIANSGALTYSVTSGSLPPGLTLNNALVAAGPYTISGTPTQFGTFPFTITASDGTNSVATDYSLTVFTPTAADVSIRGRVLTPKGQGIRNVFVTLTDANGNVRTAVTSTFGYYRFNNVAAGAIYVLNARAKRYAFEQSSQVLNVNSDVNNANFIAK